MIMHASRLPEYRAPFGAQCTGSEVTLRLEADKDSTEIVLCYSYGLYNFSYHEEPMKLECSSNDVNTYVVSLELPAEAGLLFYWFKTTVTRDYALRLLPDCGDLFWCKKNSDKVILFYVNEGNTQNGSGRISFEPPKIGVEENKYPYAWQITVYDKSFKTADFMKGAVMYQVFPDRFARDKNFSFDKMCNASDRTERVYHEDWYEDVDIYGKPETGYLACDFFGGSLYGIAERMDYIKSLGVNILYLNPIFEARSSHRYDTADYLNVDPILGGNDAFDVLISEAKKRDIRVVLDGVFSHTGADSKYFNKFDRYEGVGAFKSYITGDESKYRSWYSFIDTDDGSVAYESWWGFPDLPNVNENDLSYRRFIFGEGGVVDTWINRGASGLRLDVSDELPDSFIRQMREAVLKYSNNDGVVIGEVWEDASNKCSYGSYRDFMLGRTHDSVMGYTFRDGILSFLTHKMSAKDFNAYMEGYRERYPAEAYYSMMNLISSHDVPRAITVLAGDDDPGSRELQKDMYLNDAQMELGIKLMKMAYAFQIGYIGNPCVYYGDEALLEGYRDPFNRRTYPWDKLKKNQEEQVKFVQKVSKLREENPCLKTGFYRTIFADDDTIVFERFLDADSRDYFGRKIGEGCKRVVLLVNNNNSKTVRYSTTNDEVELVDATDKMTNEYVVSAGANAKRIIDVAPLSFVFVCYE